MSGITRFRRISGVKRSVFAENAEWNGAFSAITRYLRKSDYVREFYTSFNKIFESLDHGHVFYLMVPKKLEKRTIKSRACVPLRSKISIKFWTFVSPYLPILRRKKLLLKRTSCTFWHGNTRSAKQTRKIKKNIISILDLAPSSYPKKMHKWIGFRKKSQYHCT
jgi:hypothetical protein